MPFEIVRNDIAKMTVDAIVNTANPEPVFAAGTDAAAYRAAGEKKLLADRFEDAHKAVKLMVKGDSQKAMNLYNK